MSFKASLLGCAFLIATVAMAPAAFAGSSAHITALGAISPGSTGVGSVTHPSAGTYCVLPSSAAIQAKQAAGKLFPQLTFDFLHSAGTDVFVAVENVAAPGTAANCPSASYIEVLSYSADGTSPTSSKAQDAAFDIAF